MENVVFEISDNYRYVLISCLVNVFVYFGALLIGGSLRGKIFTKEKLEEQFGTDHKDAGLSELIKGGYPDVGNGKYMMA